LSPSHASFGSILLFYLTKAEILYGRNRTSARTGHIDTQQYTHFIYASIKFKLLQIKRRQTVTNNLDKKDETILITAESLTAECKTDIKIIIINLFKRIEKTTSRQRKRLGSLH
jgi:hypothetical protein